MPVCLKFGIPGSAWEVKHLGGTAGRACALRARAGSLNSQMQQEKYTNTPSINRFLAIMMHRIVFLDRIGPGDHESGLITGCKLVIPCGKCSSVQQ